MEATHTQQSDALQSTYINILFCLIRVTITNHTEDSVHCLVSTARTQTRTALTGDGGSL